MCAANSRYTKRLQHNDQSNKKILKFRPPTNQTASVKQKRRKGGRNVTANVTD